MLSSGSLIGMVPTTDAARAKLFYGDLLGLKFIQDDGFALVFQAHHGLIRIVRMPQFQAQPFTLLGWEVANVASVVGPLTAAGLAFERYSWFEQDELGVWTAPDGSRVAWFKDPDGNVLSVSQHPRQA